MLHSTKPHSQILPQWVIDMKNTTSVIKEANQYVALQCILNYGPVTIEEITDKTSLSRKTVIDSINRLNTDQLISIDGYASTGGRPAKRYRINKDARYSIGIDFEFPNVRIGIADLFNNLVYADQIVFDLRCKANEALKGLLDGIDTCVSVSGIAKDKIIGIGLGISGTIDKSAGQSLSIKRIQGWENVPIKKTLSDKYHVPVYIENDVHLLALVEKQKYRSENNENFAFIGIRSGIGSAIFYHGKLVSGDRGNAGFIGHTGIYVECGNVIHKYIVDDFAGEIALNKRYNEISKNNNGKYHPLKYFVERSANGEPESIEIMTTAGRYLGMAISNLVKTVETRQIIISGFQGTVAEKNIFLNELIKEVKQNLSEEMEMQVDIKTASINEEEYPLGACCYVLDHFFKKPELTLTVD